MHGIRSDIDATIKRFVERIEHIERFKDGRRRCKDAEIAQAAAQDLQVHREPIAPIVYCLRQSSGRRLTRFSGQD